MRRLMLLRHAKAVHRIDGADFDRELTESGQIDSRCLGDYIVEHNLTPDMIIFSAALRTRETAEIIAAQLTVEVEAFEEHGLYEATRADVYTLLRQLPDVALNVLIVGHNPSIADVACQLAGDGSHEARVRMAMKYPTAGLAVLDFKAPRWAEVAAKGALLERFVTPADLGLR